MNEEILKRIDILASKLNTTGEHLWHVLVKQAQIEAITDSIVLILCLSAVVFLYKVTKVVVEDEDKWWMLCPVAIVAIMCLVVGAITLFSIPGEVMNPEYFALRKILETVGK